MVRHPHFSTEVEKMHSAFRRAGMGSWRRLKWRSEESRRLPVREPTRHVALRVDGGGGAGVVS